MSFAIKAFFESIVFIVLAGVFYEFLNTLLADPNVPTGQVAVVGLIGVMFTLGGHWAVRAFGLVLSRDHAPGPGLLLAHSLRFAFLPVFKLKLFMGVLVAGHRTSQVWRVSPNSSDPLRSAPKELRFGPVG